MAEAGGGAAAAPAETTRGCYLLATEENSGTLYAWWSETAVEGAIAFMCPRKPVPKFKFSAKGGKNELTRGMRGPMVKNYYAGVAQFVKDYVRAFDGSVVLQAPPGAEAMDVGIFLLRADQSVAKLAAGELVPSLEGVKAVVAADFNCMDFQGIESMSPANFLDKGTQVGSSISFQ